jgi:hypothetical protein
MAPAVVRVSNRRRVGMVLQVLPAVLHAVVADGADLPTPGAVR